MREVARRIVPICSNYSLVVRFVEEKSYFKWGLVNHALCAAIRELLKVFLEIIRFYLRVKIIFVKLRIIMFL